MAYPRADVLQYPMDRASFTASFGYYTINGVERMHWAIDFENQRELTPSVFAAGNAEIIDRYFDTLGGNTLVTRSDWSRVATGFHVITRNLHLESFEKRVGNVVSRGEKIATQGNTGTMTTGPHLHFEMWIVPASYTYERSTSLNDRALYAVDPLGFLRLLSHQTFIRDRYSNNYYGIPYPEPRFRAARLWDTELFVTSGVEMRTVPFSEYSPVVAGLGRDKTLITDFWSYTRYETKYRVYDNDGGTDWAGAVTPWGLMWLPLVPGKTALVSASGQPSAPANPLAPSRFDGLSAEQLRALKSEISLKLSQLNDTVK